MACSCASSQTFLRSAMSEPSGEGSSSRLGAIVVVLFACCWESYFVIRFHHFEELEQLALFVASIVGSLYGTNQLSRALRVRAKETPNE